MRATFVAILALAALSAWLAWHVVRLERYHYAAQLGLCGPAAEDPLQRIEVDRCLDAARPRTSWIYDLAYGLKIL